MRGKDDQLHATETDAAILFEAAYAAIREWGKLWWYSSDGVIEVRAGPQRWRVRASRVAAWYSERFSRTSAKRQ
jgi:hypothetical protein